MCNLKIIESFFYILYKTKHKSEKRLSETVRNRKASNKTSTVPSSAMKRNKRKLPPTLMCNCVMTIVQIKKKKKVLLFYLLDINHSAYIEVH